MSVLRMVRALCVLKMVSGRELRRIARKYSQVSTDREFSIISLPEREGELSLQVQVRRACRGPRAEPRALCGQALTMRTSFCATKSPLEVAKSLGLDLIAFLKAHQFGTLAREVVFSWSAQGERIGTITTTRVPYLLLSVWS